MISHYFCHQCNYNTGYLISFLARFVFFVCLSLVQYFRNEIKMFGVKNLWGKVELNKAWIQSWYFEIPCLIWSFVTLFYCEFVCQTRRIAFFHVKFSLSNFFVTTMLYIHYSFRFRGTHLEENNEVFCNLQRKWLNLGLERERIT